MNGGDAAAAAGPAATGGGFSVAETARRVGVAASTLRTWERRYGIRPSVRTAGGHRRYTVEDVGVLQQLRGLVDAGLPTAAAAARLRRAAPPAGRGRPDGRGLAERFAAAVRALDGPESGRLATRIVAARGLVAAWTEVFVPHLQEAGERWARTGRGAEREHVGTAAIRLALEQHRTRHRPPSAPRVLAVAAPGEEHVLPLDALAAGLAGLGIGAAVLGPLPEVGVRDAVADLVPAVLVVWARSGQTADYPLLDAVRRRCPVVCAAGPGWQVAQLPAGTAHINDLPGALTAVRAWLG